MGPQGPAGSGGGGSGDGWNYVRSFECVDKSAGNTKLPDGVLFDCGIPANATVVEVLGVYDRGTRLGPTSYTFDIATKTLRFLNGHHQWGGGGANFTMTLADSRWK
jgi:hypothetical protein